MTLTLTGVNETHFLSSTLSHLKALASYIVVNLYLTRVILSEYFKEYLLSIGALIKLIYKYVKS